MAKSCPECGAEVTYSTRSVEVLEGSCADCGHSVILVAPPATPAEGDRAAAATAAPPAACWDCGGALRLTVRPNRSIEAVCTDCETVTELSVAPAQGAAPAEPEKRPFRPSFDREARRPGRYDDDRGGRPPARPCRQCGATLQFTQLPDGTVEGSCPSCGNTFTMRPRADRDSRPSYGRRPSFGGPPRRPSYGRGPPRGRPYRRRDDDEEEDDRPRRRRREE